MKRITDFMGDFYFKFYLFFENIYEIMPNVKLLFFGSEKSDTGRHELQVYCDQSKELFLSIDSKDEKHFSFLVLDKSTAIKFSRELRKQIARLED